MELVMYGGQTVYEDTVYFIGSAEDAFSRFQQFAEDELHVKLSPEFWKDGGEDQGLLFRTPFRSLKEVICKDKQRYEDYDGVILHELEYEQ